MAVLFHFCDSSQICKICLLNTIYEKSQIKAKSFHYPSLNELMNPLSNYKKISKEQKLKYYKYHAEQIFPALAKSIKQIPIITYKGMCKFLYCRQMSLPIPTNLETFYIKEFHDSYFNIRNYDNVENLVNILKTLYDQNAKFLAKYVYDYRDETVRNYIVKAILESKCNWDDKYQVKNLLKFFSKYLINITGDKYYLLRRLPFTLTVFNHGFLPYFSDIDDKNLKEEENKREKIELTRGLFSMYLENYSGKFLIKYAFLVIAKEVRQIANLELSEIFNVEGLGNDFKEWAYQEASRLGF